MIPRAFSHLSPIVRIIVSVLLVAACSEQPLPTGLSPSSPRLDIADASSSYKSGFYWLPPVVKQPSYSETFDAALSPIVEICELTDGACGSPIAAYTTSEGTGGELVRLDVDEQHYHVNWHTNEFNLSTTKLYRVSVRAGIHETLLGYADVQPVSNGSGLKKVDTDEYIGLVDGRTLPIKFRIETKIVGNVRVEPIDAEAEPGATQQFVAILSDLHGNSMSAAVTWASSDEAVATVDRTGLATAIADGEAMITATSERISGSATLTVDRIVGSVEVQPLEAEAEPGATQQFIAVVRDRQGNVMSADVTWASSDEAVATVNQTGLATAVDDGFATITATSEGISGTAMLSVEEAGLVVLDAGRGHSCAVALGGRAFCWGRNEQGQLGDGTLSDRRRPVAVLGGLTFASIASGDFHTCGITTVGQAYCWGLNQSGALGDGSQTRRLTPVAVSGGREFVSISAGLQNTCGITTDNTAYCWGQGFFGANGNGLQATALTPVAVSGGHAFASISAGSQYACGVTVAGQGYCWGNGGSGNLGNGTSSNRLAPVPVAGQRTFAQISTGNAHACGVTTSGEGYCWGAGQFGRLGNGSTANSTTPQPVSGAIVFSHISAGGLHTCGVGVNGTGYCWGGNVEGNLGTASGPSTVPRPVVGGLTWASISASGQIGPSFDSSSIFAFSCGVTVDNLIYCWGSGFFGSLGNGSTGSRSSPTPIAAFP
jgi:alpha-tubulin suppressor-like RCC1 family protein